MDGDEAIAIVGIGCRFPGANNVEEYWRVLKNGEDHVGPIPKERWNTDAWYDPDPDKHGKTYTRCAGIINGVQAWDNNFFGVSDEEASKMDPQQSMAIECTYMAMEDAGLTKREVSGTDTGVFMGVMNNDDQIEVMSGLYDKDGAIDNYTLTGTPYSIIAARISYLFNLQGSSMALDTACSSSLVAIHLGISAIQSAFGSTLGVLPVKSSPKIKLTLLTGDCTAAICGGVSHIISPDVTVGMSRSRIASPTGKCHTFSALADGYVRGEGCGVIILKKVRDAKRDGNKIWAVLVSGVNQDGHGATPITAPSGEQQYKLLQRIYSRFNIDPSDVQYIEAHGTGTPRGDPTEVESLGSHFLSENRKRITYIGSVKANIGHLESASGVAGLIKVLLMMKHSTIVPNLHYRPQNPKLRFTDYKFQVPESCIDWLPDKHGRRIACINSFGFGGTNAHAVIQQFSSTRDSVQHDNRQCLITLSAPSKVALQSALNDFCEKIKTGAYNINDVSYTSVKKRNHYPYRLSIVTRDFSCIDPDKQLSNAQNAENSEMKSHHVIFVCGGVGTCWPGMCKNLMTHFPVFREKLLEIDSHLQKYCDLSLTTVFERSRDFTDPFVSHISIFACQVCLDTMWRDWGIVPSCVVGQSVGEVAASVISGALSLENGVAVIYYRSKYLAEMCNGKMVVCLGIPTSVVEKICRDIEGVNIAVNISPKASTISGSPESIEKFKRNVTEQFSDNGTRLYELNVSCAYHSKHVLDAAQRVSDSLSNLTTNIPELPMYSTVTGSKLHEGVNSSYWFKNIFLPVQFQQAIIKSSENKQTNVFIEIGPKPVLSAHLNDILPSSSAIALPSMIKNSDETCMLETLGKLYEMGFQLNWENVPCSGNITDIPKSMFDRQDVLYLPGISNKKRSTAELYKLHHLFVRETEQSNRYELHISDNTVPFAYEHYVFDNLVLPGATYLEAAFVIGNLLYHSNYSCSVAFDKFVFVQKDEKLSFELETLPGNVGYKFLIGNVDNIFAHGSIVPAEPSDIVSYNIKEIQSVCTQRYEKDEIYSTLREAGFTHGPSLQLLQHSLVGDKISIAKVLLTDVVIGQLGTTTVHPCILDSCLQATISFHKTFQMSKGGIPYSIRHIQNFLPITTNMYIICQITDKSDKRIKFDILLVNNKGGLVVEIRDYVAKLAGNVKLPTSFKYHLQWNRLAQSEYYYEDARVNTVILTCSDKRMNVSKGQNTQSNLVLNMYSLVDTDRQSFLYEKFIKVITEKWGSLDQIHYIIYQPDIALEDPQSSSSNVFNKVVDQCYFFVLLVRTMHHNSLKTPVIIITERAVAIFENEMCNPIASSLWGLGRSVMLEIGVDSLPLLLDVTSEADYRRISQLSFKNAFRNGWVECAIRNEELFVNQIRSVEDIDKLPTYRQITRDSLCHTILKSTKPTSVTDPYLEYKCSENSARTSNGLEGFHVKKICLHDPHIFPATATHISDSSSLNGPFSAMGHQVLTFESIGTLERKPNKDVVACYPLAVESYVKVPKECIVPIGESSWYVPGKCTKMMLVWSLVGCLEKQACVSIIIDEHDGDIEQFVGVMLKKRQIKAYNVLKKASLPFKQKYIFSTILCLIPVTKTLCGLLNDQWKVSKQFVTLSSLAKELNTLELSQNHPGVRTISRSVHKILSIQNYKSSMPILQKIFKKCFKINSKPTYTFSDGSGQVNEGVISPTDVLSISENEKQHLNLNHEGISAKEEHLFRQDSCYIVIGGLSGLGWEMLRILAERGAGFIVGVSRREINDAQKEMLLRLKQRHGCSITSFSVDINDLDSTKKLLTTISSKWPSVPVKGIFHGAAVDADEHVFTISKQKFELGLRPKVQGTWNLHLATMNMHLDYFITHSSITSLIGNFTQCCYSAGCAFQNSTMLFRRGRGLSAQTINWGALNTGLATSNDEKIQELKQQGISFMGLDVFQECLVDALMHNHKEIAYCDVDWNHLFKTQNENSGIPAGRFQQVLAHSENLSVPLTGSDESIQDLISNLTNIFTKTIPVDSGLLTSDTQLLELGIDSMTSLSIVNKLKSAIGVTVPITRILSPVATLYSLASFIANELSQGVQNVAQGGGTDGESSTTKL